MSPEPTATARARVAPPRLVRPANRTVRRIRVVVEALDDFGRTGVVGLIAPGPDLQVLPPGTLERADVMVFEAPFLSGLVLRRLRAMREISPAPVVLVLDGDTDGDWLAAAEVGVTAALWRSEATVPTVTRLIRTVDGGGNRIPPEITGKLLKSIAHLQVSVLRPRGLTASGLETREVRVLQLLSEGQEVPEIARRMGYSERTVKNILYAMMTRLSLRNQAHAVAFAMRSGVI